jgi:N-acetylated-alpha-linked acidic dipeptidase
LLDRQSRGELSPETLSSINSLLIQADRAWLDESGIPGRPWFKSLYAASDEDSGYASWVLPGLRWAVEHKNAAALAREEERYLAVFQKLSGIIDRLNAAAAK